MTDVACQARAPGELVAGVGPNGSLWLATPADGQTTFRVLSGGETTSFVLPFASLTDVVVSSSSAASVVADGGLWSIREQERRSISVPQPLDATARLCGDARGDAFVLTGTTALAKRGDVWTRYQGFEAIVEGGARWLRRDGACSTDGSVWLANASDEVWRLLGNTITRASTVAAAAALTDRELLALTDERLWVGDAREPQWTFGAEAPTALASAGGYAWFAHADRLLRFRRDVFARVDMSTPVDAAHAFAAGGVWIESNNEVCRIAPTLIEVRDLQTGDRTIDGELVFHAKSDVAVTAQVGNDTLSPEGTDGAWTRFRVPLAVGWNRIDLLAADTVRPIDVLREPTVQRSFAVDIAPIYSMHCASAACHVADSASGAPDLSTLESWQLRADRIRERVLENEDMPPVAVRSEAWGTDQLMIINEWLSGGLNP